MTTVTYDFYTDVYHGNIISADDFNRLTARALTYLDSIKIADLPDIDAVKMAICAVAELWQQTENGGELASQSVGSWSVSYITTNKSFSRKLFDAAKLYIPSLISVVRWI